VLGLKNKLITIGGGIIAVLLAFVKILAGQAKRAKKEAKQYQAAIKRKDDIEDLDNELQGQQSSRRAEIRKEIKDGKEVTSLSDPDNF